MYYWCSSGVTLILLVLSLFGYQECTFWANWLLLVRNIIRLFDFEKTKPVLGDKYNIREVFQANAFMISVVV